VLQIAAAPVELSSPGAAASSKLFGIAASPSRQGNGASLWPRKSRPRTWPPAASGEKAAEQGPHCGPGSGPFHRNRPCRRMVRSRSDGPLKIGCQGPVVPFPFRTPARNCCPGPGADADRWQVALSGKEPPRRAVCHPRRTATLRRALILPAATASAAIPQACFPGRWTRPGPHRLPPATGRGCLGEIASQSQATPTDQAQTHFPRCGHCRSFTAAMCIRCQVSCVADGDSADLQSPGLWPLCPASGLQK